MSVGGSFYQGSANALLTIFDPSLGFVTGGGTILRRSVLSNFAIDAKYVGRSRIQGSSEFVEHSASGAKKLMSTAMQSLSIVGDHAYAIGEASLNGKPGYHFVLRLINRDQLGLELRDPTGALVPTLSFAPIPIQSGRLVVPHVH